VDTAKPDQSLGALIRELTREVSLLFHQEVELAKTEMSEKAAVLGRNVGAVAVGGAITLLGGLALLAAVITGLGALLDTFLPTGVAVWLSPLLVGAALTLYGYSRIQTALATLRHEGVVPKQTTQTLQENTQWLKAKIS
jgi:hypothetical protein